jgi:cytochrome c-type biogenesis protein
MIELVLIPAAFIAGILMFLAPCTLPIVPGYLAFIAGAPAGNGSRRRIFLNAVAFVLGFSLIFIALGASAGYLGSLVGEWRPLISQIAGLIIIVFGLTMLGLLRLPILAQEFHIKIPKFISIGRWQSSLLIGGLFALGWSPCIGPILGTILFLASGSATALAAEKMQAMFLRWGTASSILSIVGGVTLLLIGILMLTNNMGLLVEWGFQYLEGPYDQLLKYM